MPLHWIFLRCTISFFGMFKFLNERLHSHLCSRSLMKFSLCLCLPFQVIISLPRLVSRLKYLLISSQSSSQPKATPLSSPNVRLRKENHLKYCYNSNQPAPFFQAGGFLTQYESPHLPLILEFLQFQLFQRNHLMLSLTLKISFS